MKSRSEFSASLSACETSMGKDSNRGDEKLVRYLTPKLSCERITTKWQRAKRAATIRQTARQLQRGLDNNAQVLGG